MDSISVNQFRDNLKTYVEQTISQHEPIKVTRRAGDAFIVMSADDWEREQESARKSEVTVKEMYSARRLFF